MMEESREMIGANKKRHPRNPKTQATLERRREQLRKAQQAYRARKDVTIDKLLKRVHKLEGSIEQFSKSFLSFTSLLLENRTLLDQHSHVTLALQNITQQYLALAETGCTSSDESVVDKAATPLSSIALDKKERCNYKRAKIPSNKTPATGFSSTPVDSAEMPPMNTPPPSFSIAPSVIDFPITPSESLADTQTFFPSSIIKTEQWNFS
ncbi:hypothetical protein N7520_002260 [Penicillium odoratum]|uniref:uncharacterized protein n=1 Tax=Penicillium odoratum TaxID=1167516 RepID=UPI00254832F0|nr:uncharacterized protein N7520_002260 [Penicillium odoratum]KAJ5771731.1 hypothetical protein N7520_002260 [Penicillium odoratum]